MGGESQPTINPDDGTFSHYNTTAPKETKVFSLFNNKGKTAIVTGAGAGIGLVVAQALAESGANVAIWYHGNKEAIDRAREIEVEYGVKCRAYPSDIRSPDSITSLLTTCIADFSGRLDIFVANAGIPWTSGCFLDGPLHSYDSVMKTDLDSVYYCARAAGRFQTAYNAAKAGVVQM
ncbi:MAG: Sorbose reductase sou1, partial [Ramalina farinacea]|nr:Sorbose reductase sou1 [Ramalina farinacea]